MNILLLNQAFYPDVVATAQLASDLTAALAQAGHKVTIVCNSRGYDDPKIRFPNQEMWKGVRILRVSATGLGKLPNGGEPLTSEHSSQAAPCVCGHCQSSTL